MIANILIAIGFFGVGFLSGILMASSYALKTYKKCPKEVVLLFEEYASKL